MVPIYGTPEDNMQNLIESLSELGEVDVLESAGEPPKSQTDVDPDKKGKKPDTAAGSVTEGDETEVGAPPLNEDARDLFEALDVKIEVDGEPKLLMEYYDCVPESGYAYREQTFEEKLREHCGAIRQAISEEAHKGIGDDGKTFKKTDYQKEKSPWSKVDDYLKKKVFPNMFKDMAADVRKNVLDKFLE